MPDYTLVESLVELTESAIVETQEIFTAATSYASSSSSSSKKLTADFDYYNPLNPKTQDNLRNVDSLKTRGKYTPTSRTSNKRWTSVQAWSYGAFNNDQNIDYIEVGLVISVNILPVSVGSSWDAVVAVTDTTSYGSTSLWQNGTYTNASNMMANLNTGTHIE